MPQRRCPACIQLLTLASLWSSSSPCPCVLCLHLILSEYYIRAFFVSFLPYNYLKDIILQEVTEIMCQNIVYYDQSLGSRLFIIFIWSHACYLNFEPTGSSKQVMISLPSYNLSSIHISLHSGIFAVNFCRKQAFI